MSEEINKQELNRLSQIGSSDGSQDIDSKSIATSIVASVLYCSSPVVTSITVVVDLSIGASLLFSCSNNTAQCG